MEKLCVKLKTAPIWLWWNVTITCDQQRKKLSPLTCDNHCWISTRLASYVCLRSFSFNRSFNFLWNLTKKPKMYLKTIYYDKHNENRWKKPCVFGFIIANAIICRWLVTHIHSNRSLLRLNVLFSNFSL